MDSLCFLSAPKARRAPVRAIWHKRVQLAAISALLPSGVVLAQSDPVEEVIVTGFADRQLLLDTQNRTGSRLGLTVRETPALVDVLTETQLQERGARNSIEALNSAPGVTAANLPSSPGITSMRGFTGGSVSLLYDGVRQTTSALVTRNLDSWSFERIEVLKGPASVLYGEGALAGAINLVPKHARLQSSARSALVGYGSFDTLRVAADVNVPVGERSAARWIGSYSRSDGYVDDNEYDSFGSTLSWLWQATDAVTVDLALDYYADSAESAYWGTPLVPASVARDPSDVVQTGNGLVLDRAMRERNFNLDDGLSDSAAWWLRSRVSWQLSNDWSLSNELSYYDAERRWRNSENYTYNASTGLLDRGTTRIDHDHQFWSERIVVSNDARLGEARNRFSIGVEINENDTLIPRRFGVTAPVDPFAGGGGHFPRGDEAASFPGAGNRVDFDSHLRSSAVFIENGYNLTPGWLLVAGFRYEDMQLERSVEDFNAATLQAFERDYSASSWRLGTTYDLAPKTQLFAQYSSAVVPVGSLLLISLANSRFSLSEGESIEVGIKSSLFDRLDVTFAAFRIEQDDILTRDPANSSVSIQGGRQSSRGVELSLSAALTESLRVTAGTGLIDARFDELLEAGGADRAGNLPPNVAETVANVFATYRFDSLPVALSVGARYASHFYTNNANSVRVAGHTVVDASVGYRALGGEFSVRGRNLTDEFYADWNVSSATQVLIGAPRSFDVSYTSRF